MKVHSRISRERWDIQDRFQRCRACGARWSERALPGVHVREGAATWALEALCRGPYDLITQYRHAETGTELERSLPLGG